MRADHGGHHRAVGLDRMWAGNGVVIVAGPLAVPADEDLVRAVVALARHGGTTRVGWVRERAGHGWRTATDLEEFARACVHRVAPSTGEDLAELLQRVIAMRQPELPLIVVACGDLVLLAVDHALGDGYYMTRMLAAVVETAGAGTVPDWVLRPPTPHALSSALWGSFGRDPRRAWHLVRATARSRQSGPASVGSVATPAARGTVAPPPSPACRIRLSTPAALRGLKAWRREHGSGLSTIPLTIAAAELARRRIGITAVSSPLVLFDARRYVRPGGADVTGNFCAGLRLHVADSGNAHEIDAAMKAAVATGRPLAVLGVGALRSAAGRISTAPREHPVAAGWDLAYTHMGRPAEIARLPWRAGGTPFYSGMLPPGGPAGVTVGISETGDRINASASFDEGGVVDPEAVAEVLDLLCTDPAALLEEHRLGRVGALSTTNAEVTR
jgi:hypothetical protein